jgi:hypothetical protein
VTGSTTTTTSPSPIRRRHHVDVRGLLLEGRTYASVSLDPSQISHYTDNHSILPLASSLADLRDLTLVSELPSSICFFWVEKKSKQQSRNPRSILETLVRKGQRKVFLPVEALGLAGKVCAAARPRHPIRSRCASVCRGIGRKGYSTCASEMEQRREFSPAYRAAARRR